MSLNNAHQQRKYASNEIERKEPSWTYNCKENTPALLEVVVE